MQVIKFESKIGYINIPSPHEDEMICGYLKRVAKANCYDNLSLFLLDVNIWKIHNNWHRSEILRNDGFSYGMFNVVDIFGIEPVMRMTPLSAYIPFISRGLASRYVRSTCSKRYGNSVLNSKPDCLVKNIRHCPLCDEEEQYVRWWHCLDGVTVCAKHNVPLIESMVNSDNEVMFRELKPGPLALKTARFAKELGELEPRFFMQQTIPAIKKKILTFEAENRKHFITYLQSLGLAKAAKMIEYILKYVKPTDNELPFNETLLALSALYKNAEEFVSDVEATSSEEAFMDAIKDRFELVSEYDERIVRLKCLECGNSFISTPHSVLGGWGCPEEDSQLSVEQMFMKLFDSVNDGYELLTRFHDFQHPIKIRHIESGRVITIKPDRFLNYPHDTILTRKPSHIATVALVTHKPCGRTFKVLEETWDKNSRCSYCGTSATDSIRFVLSKDDIKEKRKNVIAAIKAYGNEPFTLGDLRDISDDKELNARIVLDLCRKGTLKRFGHAMYCASSKHMTFAQFLKATYISRQNRVFGLSFENVFFKDMETADSTFPLLVTTTPTRKTNSTYNDWFGGRIRIKLIRTPILITKENQKALTLLFGIWYLNNLWRREENDLAETGLKALESWASKADIGFEDIVPYRDKFTVKVFNDAFDVLRRCA